MNFDLHFGSHFIDFERILEPILLHFNIDVAAHTPVFRMSHRAPKARAGDDPPQAPSIDRSAAPCFSKGMACRTDHEVFIKSHQS